MSGSKHSTESNHSAESKHGAVDITRAVIIAAHDQACPIPSVECCSLLPFVDRPVLQHCVETAVRCGALRVDVIASESMPEIRELLGTGERWGMTLRIQSVADASGWKSAVRTSCLGTDPESQVLILSTHKLIPDLHQQMNKQDSDDRIWMTDDGQWAGSAIVHTASLLKQLARCHDHTAGPSRFFAELVEGGLINSGFSSSLSMFPAKDLLSSQQRVLTGEFPVLTQHLKTAEPGIWIGRNTRIHPTATLIAPVMIGSNSDIDKETCIGPNAVIGSNTIILRETFAADCHVLPFSSVGEDLCLQNCLVDPSCIHNTAIGATLGIHDQVLVADIRHAPISQMLRQGKTRCAAAALFALLAAPAFVYRTVLRLRGISCKLQQTSAEVSVHPIHGNVTRNIGLKRYVVCAKLAEQSSGRRQQWSDLFLRIFPRLAAVMRGDLQLFGINLWSISELSQVPEHWRETLHSQRPGLITESLIQFGPTAHLDERCICDAWSAVSTSRSLRWKTAIRYVRSLVKGPESIRHRRAPKVLDDHQKTPSSIRYEENIECPI